jgi:hypothetical protein
VTPRDLVEWRAFFRDNKYLTNMELAQLAGVCVKTIERNKLKLGLREKHTPHWCRPHKTDKIPVEVVPPSVWNNKEWFQEMYVRRELGSWTIGRMINRDHARVRQKLRQFGIPVRPYNEATRSKHPCCTREWLEEHYEVYGHTLDECAELAGVNQYTIYNWLVQFCMPIRDRYECLAGERSPFYGVATHGRKHPQKAGSQSHATEAHGSPKT